MTSNLDLSYHPSWEGDYSNKKKYQEILDKIANKKENETLIVKADHSIDLIGPGLWVWEKLKGWLKRIDTYEENTSPT